MSAFNPEGFSTTPTEFAVPQPLEITPGIRHQIFERMMQEVEVSTLSPDHAHYLLGLAAKDTTYAAHLKHQLERPGGFKGENAL